jgi:hypothetical protein
VAPLLLALVAAATILRNREARADLWAPLSLAAVVVASTLGTHTLALRTMWAAIFPRHVTAAYAVIAVLAALVPWRRAWPGWCLALAVSCVLAFPRGWSVLDGDAGWRLGLLALTAASAAAAAPLVPAVRRRSRIVRASIVAVVLVGVFAAGLPRLRAAFRYPFWSAALSQSAAPFDFNGLEARSMEAWPIWERLDGADPKRLAVTCGWDGMGHSCYLYPLMGSRLQNRVLYVPPTLDGSVVDYGDEDLGRAVQLRAWLTRLLEEDVDHVVLIPPSSPERSSWIVHLPDVFVREIGDERTDAWLYRFERRAAAERLREGV